MNSNFKDFRETIAGASAGVVGTVLGYPLDAIKTRMQVTSCSMPASVRAIYGDGGILGFYRGVLSPLVALTLLNTLNFSTYAKVKETLGVMSSSQDANGTILFDGRITLAGAIVGPCASIISTPFELVKTQMQLLSTSSSRGIRFNNSIEATVHIIQKKGFSAIYCGWGVNTIREIVFLSTYFSVYEHLKNMQLKKTTTGGTGTSSPSPNNVISTSIAIPLAGGFAGSIGWFISFPLDCIKSNIQGRPIFDTDASSNSRSSSPTKNTIVIPKRPSAFSIARQLVASKGIMGLYSGIIPSVMRAFLVSSSRFSAYEITLWLVDQL